MDFRNIAEFTGKFFLALTTSSTYAVPFWIAVVWLVLLLSWKSILRLLWRGMHLIEDLVVQRELFAKIDKPLKLLLVVLAIWPFLHFLPDPFASGLDRLSRYTVPLLAFYCVVQSFDLLFFSWYLKERKDANVPGVLRFVVLSAIYCVFGLMFLEWVLGVNVLPLLATSTVVTAVVGLSMQDTLKNLFAGLTMSFERRFRQGDWVMFRIDQVNTATGEVVEIGWRTTKLRTLDNNYVVIPNAVFTGNQLINYSQPTPAFPKIFEMPVRIGAPLEQITARLTEILQNTDGVLKEPVPEVLITGVRTDHVVYRVRFWVDEFAKADAIAGAVIESAYSRLSDLQAVPAVGALPEPPQPKPIGK
jgi:small-conductance mechanosensitive channel